MHREYPNEFTFCIGSAYCGSDLLAYYLECAFMSVYASNFWLAHNDPTFVHNLFLISVARNPWDKMYHQFLEYQINGGDLEFKEFIAIVCSYESEDVTYPQPALAKYQLNYFPYIFNNKGESLVDYIAKYETLTDDYFKIIKHLGIGLNESFNPVYPLFQKNKYHYKDIYDQESKTIVAKKFAEEIDAFQYTYD